MTCATPTPSGVAYSPEDPLVDYRTPSKTQRFASAIGAVSLFVFAIVFIATAGIVAVGIPLAAVIDNAM